MTTKDIILEELGNSRKTHKLLQSFKFSGCDVNATLEEGKEENIRIYLKIYKSSNFDPLTFNNNTLPVSFLSKGKFENELTEDEKFSYLESKRTGRYGRNEEEEEMADKIDRQSESNSSDDLKIDLNILPDLEKEAFILRTFPDDSIAKLKLPNYCNGMPEKAVDILFYRAINRYLSRNLF